MAGSHSQPTPRPLVGRGVEEFRSFASFDQQGSRAVEAWFLGIRGENAGRVPVKFMYSNTVHGPEGPIDHYR